MSSNSRDSQLRDNPTSSTNLMADDESDSSPVLLPDFDQLFARLAEAQQGEQDNYEQSAGVLGNRQFIPPEEDEGAAAVEPRPTTGVWSMGRSCFFRENNELQVRAPARDEGRPKARSEQRLARSRIDRRQYTSASAYSSPGTRRGTSASVRRSSSVGGPSSSPGRSAAYRGQSYAAGRHSQTSTYDFSEGKR